VKQEAYGTTTLCATLAISLSSKKNHDFVPRGTADNKQTSASSIASCALVDRARIGVPAAMHRANRWVHTAAAQRPLGYCGKQKIIDEFVAYAQIKRSVSVM